MSNKNKVLLNNVAPGQEIFALIVHDLNRPIKVYASPNLYDFDSSIVYHVFGENAQFEIKLLI